LTTGVPSWIEQRGLKSAQRESLKTTVPTYLVEGIVGRWATLLQYVTRDWSWTTRHGGMKGRPAGEPKRYGLNTALLRDQLFA